MITRKLSTGKNIHIIDDNKIKEKLTTIENIRRTNLRILSTINNPNSSRSFLQITIKLKDKDGKKGGQLVLFDMPGTESTVNIKKIMLGELIFTTMIKYKTDTNNSDLLLKTDQQIKELMKEIDIKTKTGVKHTSAKHVKSPKSSTEVTDLADYSSICKIILTSS